MEAKELNSKIKDLLINYVIEESFGHEVINKGKLEEVLKGLLATYASFHQLKKIMLEGVADDDVIYEDAMSFISKAMRGMLHQSNESFERAFNKATKKK